MQIISFSFIHYQKTAENISHHHNIIIISHFTVKDELFIYLVCYSYMPGQSCRGEPLNIYSIGYCKV